MGETMPHITVLAVFLALFLGLGATQGAQAAQAAAPTPEEKLAKQLYLSASPRKARIPPLKEGQIRISGPLNSLGQYNFDGGDSLASLRGCTWTKSRFGVMGADSKNGGSAWFYADIDEKSGQVLSVRAYGNGACGRGSGLAFFAAAPLVGSFGDVEKGDFTLRATGPAISLNTQGDFEELYEWKLAIVIAGSGDLLAAANGTRIPVKYYLGTGDEVVMEDKDPSGANIDSGRGTVTVERYKGAGAEASSASGTAAPAPDFVSKVSDEPGYGREPKAVCSDGGKLAQLPPRKQGSIRIYGVLKSVGEYHTVEGDTSMGTLAGAMWTRMDMKKFGRCGHPLAWFLADVDADGDVLYARVYVCGSISRGEFEADLREPVAGSYGKITPDGWEISVRGTSDMESRGYNEDVPMSVNIRGKGNILSAANADTLSGNYIINTFNELNFKDLKQNSDHGSVTARILR